MSFNKFTYEIKIHSINSHYICMLMADASKEEAKKALRNLMGLVPDYYRIEIKDMKTGITHETYQKTKNGAQ